jgi:outer membrane protein OmpA-like peptidoglycan-associated protein
MLEQQTLAEPISRLRLRASSKAYLLVALGLAAAVLNIGSQVNADPAFSADTITTFFVKDKAIREAYNKARDICIGDHAGCARQPPPVRRFDLQLSFQPNSDHLSESARENLAQFANALADPRLKGEKFTIDVYTTGQKAAQFNINLSERRAKNIVSYLISRGVDPRSLLANGSGSTSSPLANRDVEDDSRTDAYLSR